MQHDATNLLRQPSQENQNAGDEIFPLIYDKLKSMAGGCLKNERDRRTPPTALAHQA